MKKSIKESNHTEAIGPDGMEDPMSGCLTSLGSQL